jgi:hypothetical protein
MRSIKDECLSRLIPFGENMLRNAVREFLEHYHGERNHQGLGNVLLQPGDEIGRIAGKVECRERLGGLLVPVRPRSGARILANYQLSKNFPVGRLF